MSDAIDVSERLVICTDNEDDWIDFLKLSAKAFQQSAAFKRSHPDPEKRSQFIEAYFAYLYETEFSGGRAGLTCVKRRVGSKKEEIVYGLVGIYDGSKKCYGDKSWMMSIDPYGADLALREDEWVQNGYRKRISDASATLGFTWIYFALQVSRYQKSGIGKNYFQKAGEMIGFDGIRRNKIPSGVRVAAFAVLDDATVRNFYLKVGMTEIAHRHCTVGGKSKCVNSTSSEDSEHNCIYLMYYGYPEKDYFADSLKRYFQVM